MPKQNSQNRSVNDTITAERLNNFNADFDDLYNNGPDRLRVYEAASGTPLRIDITAGAYYIGSAQGVYGGGTDITVTDDVTNYVMINASGTIVVNTSGFVAGIGRLAQVICAGGVITNIILWNNIVYGGTALDFGALDEDTDPDEDNFMFTYNPNAGENKKTKFVSYMASDSEAEEGDDELKYINSKQLREWIGYTVITSGVSGQIANITLDGTLPPVLQSANTGVYIPGLPYRTTYTKVKEIVMTVGGTISVYFEGNHNNSGGYSFFRVYINGTAVGTEYNNNSSSSSFVGVLENFTVSAGDLVQLYVRDNGSGNGTARNFRILGNIKPVSLALTVNMN